MLWQRIYILWTTENITTETNPKAQVQMCARHTDEYKQSIYKSKYTPDVTYLYLLHARSRCVSHARRFLILPGTYFWPSHTHTTQIRVRTFQSHFSFALLLGAESCANFSVTLVVAGELERVLSLLCCLQQSQLILIVYSVYTTHNKRSHTYFILIHFSYFRLSSALFHTLSFALFKIRVWIKWREREIGHQMRWEKKNQISAILIYVRLWHSIWLTVLAAWILYWTPHTRTQRSAHLMPVCSVEMLEFGAMIVNSWVFGRFSHYVTFTKRPKSCWVLWLSVHGIQNIQWNSIHTSKDHTKSCHWKFDSTWNSFLEYELGRNWILCELKIDK